MADRIIGMRESLYDSLTHRLNTPGDWGHIKSQIGMFRSVSGNWISPTTDPRCSFTGLTPLQTKALAEKAHVYMTVDGESRWQA